MLFKWYSLLQSKQLHHISASCINSATLRNCRSEVSRSYEGQSHVGKLSDCELKAFVFKLDEIFCHQSLTRSFPLNPLSNMMGIA